jgi:hypothetical protein
MRKLIITLLLVLLAGIASVQAAEYYQKHRGDERRGEATDDMALVYVFRPATMGAAIKTWAFADDQMIGVSKAKGYYFALVPPGKHLFWGKAENTSGVEVEVKAGETYYFKTAIKMGFGKARVKMLQIDEYEARRYFVKCSFCEPTEEGRKRGAEIAANRIDAAEQNAEKRNESK